MLFDQIENLYHDNEYFMWDHEITLVPIVYVAFWAITGMVNTDRHLKSKLSVLHVGVDECSTLSSVRSMRYRNH